MQVKLVTQFKLLTFPKVAHTVYRKEKFNSQTMLRKNMITD